MPRGSDSSKIFVNSKVISRLDKIEADLIRQSKQTSTLTETAAEFSKVKEPLFGLLDKMDHNYNKIVDSLQNTKFSNLKLEISEFMETTFKKLVSDFVDPPLKQTVIVLAAKIDAQSKSFSERLESVESRHNQLCAEVTSLKDLLYTQKVEEESQTDAASSTSESEIFLRSHTPEAEPSIPPAANSASKIWTFPTACCQHNRYVLDYTVWRGGRDGQLFICVSTGNFDALSLP